MMKKMKQFLIAAVAMTLVAVTVSQAEAGRWGYGRLVPGYGWVRPVPPVVVAPRYYRPVYVAPPIIAAPIIAPPIYGGPYYHYGYGPRPARVVVRGGYYGGGMIVRTPGFGLGR